MSSKPFQRKDLKHDEFILGAGRAGHWLMDHRRRIGWALLAVAVVISVIVSVRFSHQRQAERAAALLAAAMDVYRAPVIPPMPGPVATPIADDPEAAPDGATDGGSDPETPPEEPAPLPEPVVVGLQYSSELEKYTAAIERFVPIVERYIARPSGRVAAFYLGICHAELGDTDAAIASLTQAAEASEPLISAMALYRLGQLELDVGNADAAVEYFDRLLERAGGLFPREEALMAKARAHQSAGDPRAALATYQLVLQDFAGSYSEIEARTQVDEISAKLGLDPNVQSD